MSAPLIKSLQLSADYLHMDWEGVLLGLGNRSGDVLMDEVGMELARGFLTT